MLLLGVRACEPNASEMRHACYLQIQILIRTTMVVDVRRS
jgi:hypothetical protein